LDKAVIRFRPEQTMLAISWLTNLKSGKRVAVLKEQNAINEER
jgi:hypothetical protein